MKHCWTAVVLLAFVFPACSSNGEESITVHVAASMSDAVRQIADVYEMESGIDVQMNIAGSGTLARQIAAGAPADVFISASSDWMDYLADEGKIINSTRIKIAGNELVVIVPSESKEIPTDLTELADFANARIAIGDSSHVPAGIYAREALESVGIWNELQEQLIPALDVRAALAYVEHGEAELGIVYASDALLSKSVRVAFVIPTELHSPIMYEAAILTGANEAAAGTFIKMLTGEAGQSIFDKFGFTSVEKLQ